MRAVLDSLKACNKQNRNKSPAPDSAQAEAEDEAMPVALKALLAERD